MPRKASEIPPRSASTVNSNSNVSQGALLMIPEIPEPVMPDISGIDFNVLFQCNSEYITIEKHLIHLQNQLEQTQNDIEKLQEMKERALAAPEEFVNFLKDPKSRDAFPKLQRIMSIPNLDVNRYQIRLTRRANTRFEQNLEYLMARVQEVQSRLPLMRGSVSSLDIPVSNEIGRLSNKRSLQEIREQFMEVLENNPGALKASDIDSYINPVRLPIMAQVPFQTVHQPRPRQAPPRFNSVNNDDLTDLNPMDYHRSLNSSRSSSVPPVPTISTPISIPSTPSNSIKIRIRKPSSQAPENTSITHNIPWSDDEKRKLDYLLTVFPEEDIQARRYAKIAAALGTRTGNQVASRVQKIAAKAQRHREKALRSGKASPAASDTDINSPSSTLDQGTSELVAELEAFFSKSSDPNIKSTPEYSEYLRLKSQLEAIAENPVNGVLHVGYKCDFCGIEPIIGPRWTCCSCPKDCPPIDLCDNCVTKGFETDKHKLTHFMKKIDFSEESDIPIDSMEA